MNVLSAEWNQGKEVVLKTVLSDKDAATLRIKRAIWLYFWLILFEGVLRKWIVPSLATPLLLIRDPIVLYIYFLAYRNGIFPRNQTMMLGSILAWLSLGVGIVAIQGSILVPIFGFRASFLHLPLILIIARSFDAEDIKKIGYWTLVMSIPLALIMLMQYRSSPSAWLNVGAGEDAKQLGLNKDHVRASATFSFVTGPIYYFSMVAAFLFDGFLAERKYPRWLIMATSLAVGIASVTAGSRTLLGTVCIVAACALITGLFLNTRLLFKTVKMACAVILTYFILLQIPVFGDALEVLSERIDGANKSEGHGSIAGVFSVRVLDDFTRPAEAFFEAPVLGYGLGIGTVVGSVLANGQKMSVLYRDAERELARNIFESGPLLGTGYIILRWSILISVLRKSVQCARRGRSLPFLLCGVCGFIFLNANLGQTTTLGFGVFTAGVCLAISNSEDQKSYLTDREQDTTPKMVDA